MSGPTIGCAILARNAEATLGPCLDSVRPHVDQLVVVLAGESTDNTEEVARSHGAQVAHFAWEDDFSAARNFSFDLLATDWKLWIDADDVLEGGEKLRGLIEQAGEQVGCIWFPYFYAFDETGSCTTLVDRKRLVKSAIGWRWKDRLHEDLIESRRTEYWSTTQVTVRHQHSGYGDAQKHERNLRILLKAHEEEPDNVRHWKYIGYQYFANQEWDKAISWLLKFAGDPRGTAIERWQALCYISKAYRAQQRFDEALKAANGALALLPHLDNAYFELGLSYGAKGDWGKCVFWTEQGLKREEAPRILLINPLERHVQPYATLSTAYFNIGQWHLALDAAERALAAREDAQVRRNRDEILRALEDAQNVEAFAALFKEWEPEQQLELAQATGLHRLPPARDSYCPALIGKRLARGTQPRVLFWCGKSMDAWGPNTPEETGIGGSETAVIEISRRFARAGWQVEIFATPGEHEGVHDGIGWWDSRRFRLDMKADLLVSWRSPGLGEEETAARCKLLWCHDLNYKDALTEKAGRGFDRVLGVSQFHRDYLLKAYPFLAGKLDFVPNGIDLGRFSEAVPRNRYKVVYSSSPDRGLLHLLKFWHKHVLKLDVPAELHVYYGWRNYDIAARQAGDPRTEEGLLGYKSTVLGLADHPSIHLHDRIPQRELAREFLSARVWAYPTHFIEVSCISAMEAMAAGLVPVTSSYGALPEVLGDVGFQVAGYANSTGYAKVWTGCFMAALLSDEIWQEQSERAKRRAELFTWDAAFAHWERVLSSLREKVPA